MFSILLHNAQAHKAGGVFSRTKIHINYQSPWLGIYFFSFLHVFRICLPGMFFHPVGIVFPLIVTEVIFRPPSPSRLVSISLMGIFTLSYFWGLIYIMGCRYYTLFILAGPAMRGHKWCRNLYILGSGPRPSSITSKFWPSPKRKTWLYDLCIARGVSLEGTGRLRGGSGGWPGVLLDFVADSGGCSGDSHPALVKKEFAFQCPLHAHTSLAHISALRLLYTSPPTLPVPRAGCASLVSAVFV